MTPIDQPEPAAQPEPEPLPNLAEAIENLEPPREVAVVVQAEPVAAPVESTAVPELPPAVPVQAPVPVATSAPTTSKPPSDPPVAQRQLSVATRVEPDYPRDARRTGQQGSVLLDVQVDGTGHPTAVTVARSSGHRVLDEAALSAVKCWTFVAAALSGSGTTQVEIVLRLHP